VLSACFLSRAKNAKGTKVTIFFAIFAAFAREKSVRVRVHPAFAACFGAAGHG